MAVRRLDANPLLTPDDLAPSHPDLQVMCTLNPGAVRVGDETLLLVRVGEEVPSGVDHVAYTYFDVDAGEIRIGRIGRDDPHLITEDPRGYFYKGKMLLTSMSHLRIARSTDGVNFTFDPEPFVYPSSRYEAYGCEDPRITPLDGRYYITYTAVSDRGVTVALAETEDFRTVRKYEHVIFPPYQKDVAIFPEKVRGMYVCRHRPYMNEFNDACIWTGYSPDLKCWGLHEQTLAPMPGTWEGGRVGCGAAPLKTDAGWLEIYHAADESGRYHLGVMLSDLEHPERVLCRSAEPILEPETDYEVTGVYGNCVFTNGVLADEDGTLTIYYGAADRICAAAVTTVDEMIAAAQG